MRSLNPSIRAKAIELANNMLEQGHVDKQRVIMLSVEEARRWARLRQVEAVGVPTYA